VVAVVMGPPRHCFDDRHALLREGVLVGMADTSGPEKQLLEVAVAALSGGLFVLEHDDQLQELRQLREQLDLLGKWAVTHNDPDGRMLQSVAMALRLLSNGGITGIVRRIAATLQARSD